MTDAHADYSDIIEVIADLSPDKYYKFVFQHPFDFYQRRVRMIGAEGFNNVLDAGHGFGQWSIALAQVNKFVTGVDRNEPRLKISQVVKDHYAQDNVDFRLLDVVDISDRFPAKDFDLVWTWNTIQFMDRGSSMTSFNKVLKKAGVLIIGGTNTSMRWLYKIFVGLRMGIKNKGYYKACYKGFRGAEDETGANAINFSTASKTAEKYGFELEEIGYDGEICLDQEAPLHFESTPLKLFQNIEMRLVKVRDI